MIEYQRIILADRVRNDAFYRALKKVVKPRTSVVADIGSGTGFLAFLASKLGAKTCTLYESSELLELSRRLAEENGIRNCHFVGKHSTLVKNTAKADIVVSETLGNFAIEEGIIETMNDARRFLKPGGVLLPQSLTQFVAPVVTDRLWKEVASLRRIGFGLQFSRAEEISLNNIYVRTVRSSDLLKQKGAVQVWDRIDFRRKNESVRSAAVRWPIARPVTVYGFAVWWECGLIPGVSLSTSPSAPPTHWEQIFLPVLEPFSLIKGEILELRLHVDARREVRINVAWDVRRLTSNGKIRLQQRLDMQRGQIG